MVLFDLDGTLVDTAPDMTAALNRLLEQEGLTALPAERVRNSVSKGSPALVELGFGNALEPQRRDVLRQRFLELYSQGICVDSRLFDGMDGILDELDAAGVRWGVVTNKPGWLTAPLLEALDLLPRAACVVGGDTLARRKPFPDPLLHACEAAGRDPLASIYVGDDERDVQAGKAAGMSTLIARWGYIDGEDSPQAWGADAMMQTVHELGTWLQHNIIQNAR
jgi:phosphoglycolate phosphatase